MVSRAVEAGLSREVVVEFLSDAVAESLSDVVVHFSIEAAVLMAVMAGAGYVAVCGKPQVTLASNFQLSPPRPPSASRATTYVPGGSRPYHAAQQPACRVGLATFQGSLWLGVLWAEGPSKYRSDRY